MFVINVIHAYFIHMSQGSVETQLWRGGIYNNRITANCPQSVPVKEFWKSVINWRRYGQKYSATFSMAHPVSRPTNCDNPENNELSRFYTVSKKRPTL